MNIDKKITISSNHDRTMIGLKIINSDDSFAEIFISPNQARKMSSSLLERVWQAEIGDISNFRKAFGEPAAEDE